MCNKKEWYQYDKTECRMRQCLAPYENIWIGTTPNDGMTEEDAKSFDAIVNVSCTPCVLFSPARPDQRIYWYPVNEGGQWSYAYFVLMFSVLDFHHSKGHKIYVHCHAGAYRSPTIVTLWLEYRGERKAMEIAQRVTSRFPKPQDYPRYLGNLPDNYHEFMLRLQYHKNEEWKYIESLYRPVHIPGKETDNHPRPELLWRIKNRLYPVRNLIERFKRFITGMSVYRVTNACSHIEPGVKPWQIKLQNFWRRFK